MAGEIGIRRLIVSPFETNCYVVFDTTSHDAFIIDPGDNPDAILQIVRDGSLTVCGIVNTHGHADHIAANGILHEKLGAPIIIHELDAPFLADPNMNLSTLLGNDGQLSPPADRLLRDGDDISVGSMVFKVIHTPGHTPGGICLLMDKILFSGDTLFLGSIGRTDFPGGSHGTLIESICSRLLVLPDDTVAYPGHGSETTIGDERRSNLWL